MSPGEEVIEQRRAGAADVQVARRRRREAHTNLGAANALRCGLSAASEQTHNYQASTSSAYVPRVGLR